MKKPLACLLAACLLIPALCLSAGAAPEEQPVSEPGAPASIRSVQFHDTLTLFPDAGDEGGFLAAASYRSDGSMAESVLLPLSGASPLSFRLTRPDEAARLSVFRLDGELRPVADPQVLEGDGLRLDGEAYDDVSAEAFRILAEYTKAHAVEVDARQHFYLRPINDSTTAYLVYEEDGDALDVGSVLIDSSGIRLTSLIRIPGDLTVPYVSTVNLGVPTGKASYLGRAELPPSELYQNSAPAMSEWNGPESYAELASGFLRTGSLLALLQFDQEILSGTPCSVGDLGFVNVKNWTKTEAALSGAPDLPAAGSTGGGDAGTLCALIRDALSNL